MELSLITNNVKYITSISIPMIFSLYKEIIIRMINVCKLILRHVKEYCQEAAIHGPQHIVSPRLAIFERLVFRPADNLAGLQYFRIFCLYSSHTSFSSH